MPGITGIISKANRGAHRETLNAMVRCMMHESTYRTGSYVNEEMGVYVGWTCHPNSYADGMPVLNEENNVALIFAGEHFDEWPGQGTHAAADVLHCYATEGQKGLRKLNGWFAGLLIDTRNSTVLLFNDRYGMHRIYYHEDKDGFLFGSEAKSLLTAKSDLRRMDVQSLGEFINTSCVLERRTLFSGVSLLPGGAVWTWDHGAGPVRSAYFDPSEWEHLPALSEGTFYSKLKETALSIMPRYFREKTQVGISLTGGLDSRMIMACLNPAPGELPCYTFGGPRDVRDITIARQVAKLYGQSYEVVRLGEEFFAQFPRLAEKTIRVSDGNLDVCSTHDMYFNELAKGIAPIRVTGKFGSEIVRDHTMFNAGDYQGELFVEDLKPYFQEALTTFRKVKSGHPLSVALFKDFPWREYNKIALEQSQMVFRSPYMDNDLARLMYQAPAGVRSTNWPQRRIIRECNEKLGRLLSDMGFGEGRNPAVARGLEFYYYAMFKLDYRYVFALPHWLTRIDTLVMSLNGEQPILGTQKFEHYRIWFRRELAQYLKEILLDSRTGSRSYFNRRYLESIVTAHTNGTHNYMSEINLALSLELTCRTLIDG